MLSIIVVQSHYSVTYIIMQHLLALFLDSATNLNFGGKIMGASDKRVQDTFAARLKSLREARGMTRVALADGLEVSRASIGYYETRERNPDIVFLNRAAEFFGVSSDYLLGLTDVESGNQSVRDAVSLTGLSEDAINQLKDVNKIGFSAVGALDLISDLLASFHYGLIARSITRAAFAVADRSIPDDARTTPTEDGRIILSPQDTIAYLDMQVRYVFNRDVDNAISKYFSVFYKSLKEGGNEDAEEITSGKRDDTKKDGHQEG